MKGVIGSFCYRTLIWLVVGKLLKVTIEGETCSACGKIHARGNGCPWRCPE